MKYYIIAGEASGDLHGSNLCRALQAKDVRDIRFWGGDLMAEIVGEEPVMHYRDLAFMGFVEVVKNLSTILGFFKTAKRDILQYQPDRVVLIDYPGFNLRLAKWLHRRGIPVTYYITPQVWAWHSSRIKQLAAYCDQRLVILPFEERWFADRGVESQYVGHPLIDAINRYPYQTDFVDDLQGEGKILLLLPGSRSQEIKTLLPIMLAASDQLDGYRVIVSKVKHQPEQLYHTMIDSRQVQLVQGHTYDLLQHADMAIVTSGTATLETALHKVPQVVCYKGSEINYQIGKRLVDLPHISLVNLILEEEVVPELIQHDCTAGAIADAVCRLADPCPRTKLLTAYGRLWEMLDRGASDQAAARIIGASS